MSLNLQTIRDKVEFFESLSLEQLEADIQKKIEQNEAMMLGVHHVQHHVHTRSENGRSIYTAVVHFRAVPTP